MLNQFSVTIAANLAITSLRNRSPRNAVTRNHRSNVQSCVLCLRRCFRQRRRPNSGLAGPQPIAFCFITGFQFNLKIILSAAFTYGALGLHLRQRLRAACNLSSGGRRPARVLTGHVNPNIHGAFVMFQYSRCVFNT